MTRLPRIPPELTHAPFSLDEARAAGLTLSALKSSAWIRLGDQLYASRQAPDSPWLLLEALHRITPDLTFAGRTAAWMHGLDFNPSNPVEAIAPPAASSRTRAGISIRRCDLTRRDTVRIRNLPATSMTRTLRDFCAKGPRVEALVAMDMAFRLQRTSAHEIAAYANENSRTAGCARLRELAELAEPAESPKETHLRLLLIDAGLPRPSVQVDLTDERGDLLGRADLYYPAARLVIEFDGMNHKNRLIADNRRQNGLIGAGFTLLRFTTADLEDRPDNVVAQVRGVLAAQGQTALLSSAGQLKPTARARLTSGGRNAVGQERRPYLRYR